MVFQEAPAGQHPGWMKPIRELGIQIAGTDLEKVLRQFQVELNQARIQLEPSFYLSDEWGVPFDTTAIAIPFYLARQDLIGLHTEQVGFIEGATSDDLLRYLRHEMGHVVNYGYKLYAREDWTELFGSIDKPYVEEYRPVPFHRDFVQHLPGWYAQKHPDEDWAETFAVWLTPGQYWQMEYEARPRALAKLRFCESLMKDLESRAPLVTNAETDEAVEEMSYSLQDYYGQGKLPDLELPPELDAALRAIFEATPNPLQVDQQQPASLFLRSIELDVMADIYRWTGHFPERTRQLVRHLAKRADELNLRYATGRETRAAVAVAAMLTALAMNCIHHGSYSP